MEVWNQCEMSEQNRRGRQLPAMALAVWLLVSATLTAGGQGFRQEYGQPKKSYVETMAMPDHADSRYRCGEAATLRLTARQGGRPLEGVSVRYRVGAEMLPAERYDSVTFVGGEALLPLGTLREPGFLACRFEYRTADGRTVKDLVKVAFEPDQIRAYTVEPADFRRFWQKALKEARRVPLEPTYREVAAATDARYVTRLVRLHVGKDKWMQGYLTMPRAGSSGEGAVGERGGTFPVVLCPPGAGSGKIYPSDYFPERGCIYLKLEIHDNDQLLDDASYETLRRAKCDGYPLRGMVSRDTYYYKDVYVGCARAVDFLCTLPEWDGRNVIVTGGSQGGALTIVTAALNEQVTLCAPFYPALCDLTAFLHHRAGGWPKFFSDWSADSRVDIGQEQAVATLQYFDVVNFARWLTVPTFMSWGYADDTCSPTSVWAAWNAMTAPKTQDITPTSGHWRFAESQQRCWEWMKERLR
jgi:cephalosporin-C deacetylase-like acetyl esterase